MNLLLLVRVNVGTQSIFRVAICDSYDKIMQMVANRKILQLKVKSQLL